MACSSRSNGCCGSSNGSCKPERISSELSRINSDVKEMGLGDSLDLGSFATPVLSEVLRKLPLRHLMTMATVNRHWRDVSEFVIATSSLCLCYRLKCSCDLTDSTFQPANVAIDGHCCEADKSIRVGRLGDFANSKLAARVETLAICCPANIQDVDHIGVLPADLFYLAKKFPNVKKLEFTGSDVDIFYTPMGRPVLKNLFPQLADIRWYCDAPEYQIRLECRRSEDFMPAVKLDCKERSQTALVSAFAKVDLFIEALRAEGMVNQQTFSNTAAMRTFSVLMPIASLTFSTATQIGRANVLAAVTELRLIVSEQQNLVQTLINLPNLKTLELDDQHRCSCIVRLPLLPQLTSLTLGIHACALDRTLLSNVPKLRQLHIYSEKCGGLWLELVALNMCHLPLLETLILNCWEDSKLCCPCDIDDVVPDIVDRAEGLRSLVLGSGVQPTVKGLRSIVSCPTLKQLDCYLCTTSDSDTVTADLVQLLSGSSVEIMRTKVSVATSQVVDSLEILSNTLSLADSPKRLKMSATDTLWESPDDLVVNSAFAGHPTLFRVRKVPINVPISRLKQLVPNFGRTLDPRLVCCEIPQLCGPQGPSFSCGCCGKSPEIPSCETQRCMSVNSTIHPKIKCLAMRTPGAEPAPCCADVCSPNPKWLGSCVVGCLKANGRPMPSRLGKITWVNWDDIQLDRHYSLLANPTKLPPPNCENVVRRQHWLQFICAEDVQYK